MGAAAPEVELPPEAAAVIVPVNGIWGGNDYVGTLIQTFDGEADRKGSHLRTTASGGSKWVEEYNVWVLERDVRGIENPERFLHHVLTVQAPPLRRPQDRPCIGSW